MHDTAFEIGAKFLDNCARGSLKKIVEIGSLNVNGSLRERLPAGVTYVGLDYVPGDGVDLIARPGEPLPLESNSADAIVSSSQMEHDPEFWVTLLELFRVVKPGGYVYINAPSNGSYHAYPSDNWRFFPDSGKAFAAWGRKNDYPMTLLESFTAKRVNDSWNDFVCVFYKGQWSAGAQIDFLSDAFACENIWRYGASEILKPEAMSEDQRIIATLRTKIAQLEGKIARRSERSLLRKLRRAVSGTWRSKSNAAPRRAEWDASNAETRFEYK